jgi:CHASE1-domain containing sensor protein
MASAVPDPPSPRALFSGTARSLTGLRAHAPSLVVLVAGCAVSGALFLFLRERAQDRERAAFSAEAAPIVANLRSGFELPLEVLRAAGALFESSGEVTRAEFARFVKPALERHPGIRALEWIPIVPGVERDRYEAAARADGLVGFRFRERTGAGDMIPARERAAHYPIYFMEPGHPLVLGFDCASEPERRACAERARVLGTAVASQRITLIDDSPTVASIAVFQPVYDPARPRAPAGVRGFTAEVFRVRAVAERAIEDSLRRGVQVLLLDPDAPPDRRVLFESAPALASQPPSGPRHETTLRYADRSWHLVLTAAPGGRADLLGWPVLLLGVGASVLGAFGLSAARIIARLRRQVRVTQQLGQYTLLEKLGEGGAGVVYKARHAMLRRPTAIKLLAAGNDDPARLARFEREVQLTSELCHPNTIAIYDYGRTPDGVFYYAMEYIDGITLQQLVDLDGPLPAGRVVHLLTQACRAIAEAHAVGLIHRDLKPANLMVCRRGGIADFLKVMDFGLVKDLGAAGDSREVTRSTAAVLGTPLYLAPESISRPSEVDGRADLYALGAVAYTLLVGAPVFVGNTVVEVCGHHLHSVPTPPSARAPGPVPPALERIILRCLAKRPADRFPSVSALLEALAAVSDAPWTEGDAERWWAARPGPRPG